ncbi:MAG: polysaccharide biosynthesis protein [Abditibacteriota bacterium]|nr:polysaccharide biosynthesis protein [Abditibacteriota bacterium]
MEDKEIIQKNSETRSTHNNVTRLFVYDFIAYLFFAVVFLYWHDKCSIPEALLLLLAGGVFVFGCRIPFKVYRQVWRYGSTLSYARLIVSDVVALGLLLVTDAISGYIIRDFNQKPATYAGIIAIISLNLIFSMVMRLAYQYAYHSSANDSPKAARFRTLLRIIGRLNISSAYGEGSPGNRHSIRIAVVGAGRTGASLANELINNPYANYKPCIFIDRDPEKVGRQLYGISIMGESRETLEALSEMDIQEVVFALPAMDADEKRRLYEYYKKTGCKVKIYDYPNMRQAGETKRTLREFDIEELLFRKPIELSEEKTIAYYRDKVILVTGGGGSIGSELCRQIAGMKPRKLIILDVYENGAYDIQQELRIAYGDELDLQLEILSVCDREGLETVFSRYRPDVVLNAAAHKHVPLMEHNCCEAVKNNVFGTLNTVDMAVKYGAGRFIMISTDKAVNPTNVMGATKRMCEMIVQSRSTQNTGTVFSCTRFGNVLGSAGSVIPLFKRQIAKGGPVTITDKRIIRYFMTIPEASQLVLQSGAMAKSGELFVLDMGKPVRILDMAENMIRLSGKEPYRDIDIVETGLRPGEKLYEELLIKSEDLDKTDNSMIFVERDTPLSAPEIEERLDILREAVSTNDDKLAKEAMRRVVPTFRKPEVVNAEAAKSEEMNAAL